MQLFELPSGVVRWSRSARRTRRSDTVSAAVHEAVSSAVWDCLKHLTGWDAIVKQDSLVRLCSRTGLSLDSTAESATDGLEVKQVAIGSVWQQAGLRRGDIITRVNGRSLDCATAEWPGRGRPKEVSLTVKRGDDLVELTVPLGNEALLPPAADRQERRSRNVR
jgi:S1-C subfamily serine protease